MVSRIAKTVFRIPKQINMLDTAQWAATGLLGGALARLIYNKVQKKNTQTVYCDGLCLEVL